MLYKWKVHINYIKQGRSLYERKIFVLNYQQNNSICAATHPISSFCKSCSCALWGYRGWSVQSLSHVQLFATPWTAACQASLSITNSQSLLKCVSTESVMPSNHLILCCPLFLPPSIFPSIGVFSDELVLCISSQIIGVSASASVLPMNIQDWFPLGWTGWISLQSKGLSRVFSNLTLDWEKRAWFSPDLLGV